MYRPIDRGGPVPCRSPLDHQSAGHVRQDPATDGPALDISRLRFLVIDKSPIMRRAVARVLRALGVREVEVTGDPYDAFACFCHAPADIVLSDWAPELDSLDLLRRIRLDDGSPDPFVPFIIVSADTDSRQVFRARDAGMTDFIAKPFTVPLLYGRIRAAVTRQFRYVRADDFFGPDRRRRPRPFRGADRRRHDPAPIATITI